MGKREVHKRSKKVEMETGVNENKNKQGRHGQQSVPKGVKGGEWREKSSGNC